MNKPVNILILDNTFTFGGAINSLCYLLRAMDKERFKPILLTGQPDSVMLRKFPDIQWYHFIPKLPWINNRIYTRLCKIPIFKARSFRFLLNLSRFLYWQIFVTLPEVYHYYRIGRKHDVKVVHLNNILGSQQAGILAAKMLRVPCVAHLRDFEEIHPVTKFYARLIDHHIAISTAIKENLIDLGVTEDRISLIYDALDLAEFHANVDCGALFNEFRRYADRPRYGIFGRVVDWKGIREFILAASIIAHEVPEAVGFIVGGPSDGDESFEDEMHALSIELGLTESLVFTGFRNDIPALMKFMDIVVHASKRAEPFGMVLIEGMAMAKPVVATKAGGPLDIVDDGVTGNLVKVGDEKALADAVICLFKCKLLCHQMGANGRIRVESNFSNETYAAKVQQVYALVLGGAA